MFPLLIEHKVVIFISLTGIQTVIDYCEWADTLMPAITAHVKKSHQMKPKEYLDVWRSLIKVPDDDPRIKKYKHGGTDVSGVEHSVPAEPGHVDIATLLASIRSDGDGIRSIKNQKLYKKFFNGVLSACTTVSDEEFTDSRWNNWLENRAAAIQDAGNTGWSGKNISWEDATERAKKQLQDHMKRRQKLREKLRLVDPKEQREVYERPLRGTIHRLRSSLSLGVFFLSLVVRSSMCV